MKWVRLTCTRKKKKNSSFPTIWLVFPQRKFKDIAENNNNNNSNSNNDKNNKLVYKVWKKILERSVPINTPCVFHVETI